MTRIIGKSLFWLFVAVAIWMLLALSFWGMGVSSYGAALVITLIFAALAATTVGVVVLVSWCLIKLYEWIDEL